MKKILILYGSYGGGHLSAANSIANHYKANYPDIEIKVIDCIEYINKYINKISTEAYKEIAKKAPWIWKRMYNDSKSGPIAFLSSTTFKALSLKLISLFNEEKPDLIISTQPFASQMVAYLKEKEKINYRLATIMTDFHIHPQWLVCYKQNDYFFVANNQMKRDMVALGVDFRKIIVTGIPVSEKFSEKLEKDPIYDYFGFSKNKKTILFFAGGEFGLGRNKTFMLLKAIIRLFPDVQVLALSGKNKKMREKFEELVNTTNSSDRIKILDYTDKVPELMHIADLVITKPGGLTVSEALASNIPLVLINPIPGQEEENAEFLTNNNVAVLIKDEDNISRILKFLFKDKESFNAMIKSTKVIAKPQSTKTICEYIYKNVLSKPSPTPIIKETPTQKIKNIINTTKDGLKDGLEDGLEAIKDIISPNKKD